MANNSLIAVKNIHKTFSKVIALQNVSFGLDPGEVHCLLGDNGAGKSTLIRILSGVHQPDRGEIFFEQQPVKLTTPTTALELGIATVHQDLGLIDLMSISRNFFIGQELTRGNGLLRRLDKKRADSIVQAELAKIGINVRDPNEIVGGLSGGERQSIAIARAVYFGAKLLILDEPTSALGVHQASIVIKYINQAKQRGIGVIFITHNVHHAFMVADKFTLLNHGSSLGTFAKGDISKDAALNMMAGLRDSNLCELDLRETEISHPA